MATPSQVDARPISGIDDLLEEFHEAHTPEDRWLIGAEAEKFGIVTATGAPVSYDGEHSVLQVFAALESHGWKPGSEIPGGPTISLSREGGSVTLEPAAQLELSGAPLENIHQVRDEMDVHLVELAEISTQMGLCWLGVGYHPFARQADLSWVPKRRYKIMRDYLPTKGVRGRDMMRRTATVQANFDYSSEEDALRKLLVGLKFGPLVNALLANSPFVEGKIGEHKTERGAVWLEMDPSRSGVIEPLWKLKKPGYRDYVEWGLDAGMFCFEREGEIVHNTGQTFRSFLADGFEGHRAQRADWSLHLNTLFPEARIKQTLEVRSADALPTRLSNALPALYTGLFYDEKSLAEAEELGRSIDPEDLAAARKALVTVALGASIGPQSAQELAEKLLDISVGGLKRRARLNAEGKDESLYLEPIVALVSKGQVPADLLTEGLNDDTPPEEFEAAVLQRARM